MRLKRLRFGKSIAAAVACTALTSGVLMGASWGDCSGCGTFVGEDCGYGAVTEVQSGTLYGPGGVVCEKTCAGNTEGASAECPSGEFEQTITKKYSISGDFKAGDFGLSGDWEKEQSQKAKCVTPPDKCSSPGCCVGPTYGYFTKKYRVLVKIYTNNTRNYLCRKCSDNTVLGYLTEINTPVCGKTAHAASEPTMNSTVAAYCAGVGQN